MPRIEVTSGAVQDMGAQVQRNGREMRTVVAALDRARAAGAGMGEAATTAAYEETCAVWHECLPSGVRHARAVGHHRGPGR